LTDFIASAEVFCIDPTFILYIEGMLGRGFELFTVNGDLGESVASV
jgi:hypothetical protein